MTNTKSINELIVEAREIKSATPSFVVELVRGQGGLYETTSKIDTDANLTFQGKQAKKGRVKKVAEYVLMTEMKERREKYDALLDEAEKQVRAKLTPQFEDLEESDRILYDAEISDLKTKVLLSVDEKLSMQYLEKMVNLASKNGKTAHELQGYLTGQLAEMVGKSQNLAHIRPQLLTMSKKLARASQVDDFDGIKAQLNDINEMREVAFAIGQTQTAITENIGHVAGRYVNNPTKYFEDHSETVEFVEGKIENHKRFGHDLYSE
ncbi:MULTISPECIES: hypothetical protein [Bacillus cereus group]|uniref:hypothetical protein n=1 Tax=Bacillus cereus group TaxID=86661 RepID=UPI0020C4377F|nr:MULTISPECIES: hypothetical protein [Bacillus cereus group]MEB9858630.1 hypothetical protein [Bacillus cereus]MEB9875930.1 hypothetical protein [Bacillus cereus]